MENSARTGTALKGWTVISAIVKNGWNTFKVLAVGSSLTFYFKHVYVFGATNASLKTGKFDIGLYRKTGTTGNMLFVDSASDSTSATADINPSADVSLGKEIPGGSNKQAS